MQYNSCHNYCVLNVRPLKSCPKGQVTYIYHKGAQYMKEREGNRVHFKKKKYENTVSHFKENKN